MCCSCCKNNHTCQRLHFVWSYHVVYFFKTLLRPNPDTCTGYEIYIVDRILEQVIPLTYGSKRVGSVQKLFIILQLFGCIYMAVECYNFHLASLRWFHDAVYTLWEFVTWVQFPIFIFFHLLSAKFKVNDPSWTQMVLCIVGALVFLTCTVILCTLMWIPTFPIGIMENAWAKDSELLDKAGHQPEWIIYKQRPLECCGYREPNDWTQGRSLSANLPFTCCPMTTYTRNCTIKHAFPNGCLWKVKHYYERCRPLMVTWGPINVAVLAFNYGLYRYLFNRHSRGWQVPMTWRQALLPVLHIERPQLPLEVTTPEPEPLRMTESEAILDIISRFETGDGDG